MEEKDFRFRGERNSRWLFFFLGLLLASAIGLAIALGVTLINDDDDKGNDGGSSSGQMGQPTTAGPALTTPTPQATTTKASYPEDQAGLCVTPSCVLRAGELLQAMDRSVDPCEDFYRYSCGQWQQTHSIPESQSSFSRFGQLRDIVALELKGLLEKPYESTESDSIRKAKNMYQSCLNEETLDTLGPQPLKDLVNQVASWPLTSPATWHSSSFDLESLLGDLSLLGLSPMVDVTVYQDDRNASQYVANIDQPSLGLNRNYMLKARNSSEVTTYEELRRQQMIQVLGIASSNKLTSDIRDVVDFEIKLAQITASQTERRDIDKFYKKTTIGQLATDIPQFKWMKWLTKVFGAANVTVTQDTEVVILAEDYVNNMLALYHTTRPDVVANYLLSRLVDSYVGYLNKDTRDLSNDLRKVLYGISQSQARWKTCVDNMDRSFMPAAVGQLYVTSFFPPSAKRKAEEMISQIRQAIKRMISEVEWMDQETKNKALDKADAIIEKIGYPDYQFNDTVLDTFYQYVDYQPDTYFQNGLNHKKSSAIENAKLLEQAPSRADWYGSASTVNAYYSPSKNSITFPSGILQPPFYSEDFPMSMMFGGIGMVIGHEITHGFDDQGRKYDKEGNNQVWWSKSSSDQYNSLSSCYVDQYSQQMVAGMHVNGNLTLGENIADNGGIKAAFIAFQTWQSLNGKQPFLPGLGLTHEQLFFINFAQGWCNLITDQGAINRMLTDPHSPATVRVRVPASNSPEFAKAFHCPVGSPMNPEQKCHLW